MAEKINKGRRSAEEAEREARVIQEIEAHIEGVEHVRYLLYSKFMRINLYIAAVNSSELCWMFQVTDVWQKKHELSGSFLFPNACRYYISFKKSGMAQFTGIFMDLSDDYHSLCLFMLDSEPPEEVSETGNCHGGGKKSFFEMTDEISTF